MSARCALQGNKKLVASDMALATSWVYATKKVPKQERQKLNRVSALRIRFGIWFIENLRM